MAEPVNPKSLPTVLTTDNLRELVLHDEVAQGMVTTGEESPVGTVLALALPGGTQVGYVFDGEDLWHRDDLKVARNLQKRKVRETKLRELKSGATSDTGGAADGS